MSFSLGLTKKLFTITARELNGGTVEIFPSGLTNEIVKTNGTNNRNIVTMDVFLKKALDREVWQFLPPDVLQRLINKITRK